jgi:hypothetical protein
VIQKNVFILDDYLKAKRFEQRAENGEDLVTTDYEDRQTRKSKKRPEKNSMTVSKRHKSNSPAPSSTSSNIESSSVHSDGDIGAILFDETGL